jgi:DNA-binding transcriptional MerR regulator
MTDLAALWTLPELTERVVAALSGDSPGANGAIPSGRVREVPDARTIRWYQTTGLVDRPELRGRTAYYSERHLLQLLAIKRLQAQGRQLGEVQAMLAGLSDEALAAIARPADPPDPADQPRHAAAARRFWTRKPAPASTPASTPAPAPAPAPAPEGRRPLHATVDVIQLRDDVTVLVDTAGWHLTPAQETEVLASAAPLLEALQRFGVITPQTADNPR